MISKNALIQAGDGEPNDLARVGGGNFIFTTITEGRLARHHRRAAKPLNHWNRFEEDVQEVSL
jgi:hypothetical protein